MPPPPYPPISDPLSRTTPVTSSLITDKLLATPTHGASGLFGLHCKTRIFDSTDPKDGLNLVRDVRTWPRWNSFTPKAEIESGSDDEGILKLGTIFKVYASMEGKGLEEGDGVKMSVSKEVVTLLEEFTVDGDGSGDDGAVAAGRKRKGWRIAWNSLEYPSWVLRAERVLEFVEVVDEEQGPGWEFTSW
jgi:hypothetical protein